MLLALKMEQRCHEPGKVVASKSWGRQGNGISPRHSRKECSAADTLILAQWGPFWTSNYRRTNLYCFKPLRSWYFGKVARVENTYGEQRQAWFSPSQSTWF